MNDKFLNALLLAAATAGFTSSLAVPNCFADDGSKTREVKAKDLKLNVPLSWEQEQPTSQFRLTQFSIPAAKGDKEGGEFVVFFFAGGAGGVAANVQRWTGQFQPEERQATITQGKSARGDYVFVELSGTYNKSVGPPFARQTQAVPGSRVLNVIVTVPEKGVYYLKMAGPDKTVAQQADALRQAIGADRAGKNRFNWTIELMDIHDNPRLTGVCAYLVGRNEEQKFVEQLVNDGQEHLFVDWDEPGVRDEEKEAFLEMLHDFDDAYPGGLVAYIKNVRRLLSELKEGVNPFDGYEPRQPDTVDLTDIGDAYTAYENLAARNFDKIAVVLVAGGLGERLGFHDIKLNIPFEVTETTSYLRHYCQVLKAMELRMSKPRPVPLIIMTSPDTDDRTRQSLVENGYFGLCETQVTILRQELVPAIADNDGRLSSEEKYQLSLKPHGHGDVHTLLHTHAVARLRAQGIEYLVFIQDTNGQVFHAAFAAVGVSMKHGFDFNSEAVSRIPGEACGALVRLVPDRREGSAARDRELTLNVEYHVLDSLLRATIGPEGDTPDTRGRSRFPGNINVLTVNLDNYCQVLQQSRGWVPEFVNPRYTDETKTVFEKPTRLETLMQDLPRLLPDQAEIGVTVFDRRWSFSANKNHVDAAREKFEAGGPPESAASAESDFYAAGRLKCRLAGMKVEESETVRMLGIPFTKGPRVVLKPSFALTVDEVKAKISGGRIADEATLVLDGKEITLHNVELAGTSGLVIKAVDDAEVKVQDLHVCNDGFRPVELTAEELSCKDTPEYLTMRGYRIVNFGARIYELTEPGRYTIDAEGNLIREEQDR